VNDLQSNSAESFDGQVDHQTYCTQSVSRTIAIFDCSMSLSTVYVVGSIAVKFT
jgi:hypothetical protein